MLSLAIHFPISSHHAPFFFSNNRKCLKKKKKKKKTKPAVSQVSTFPHAQLSQLIKHKDRLLSFLLQLNKILPPFFHQFCIKSIADHAVCQCSTNSDGSASAAVTNYIYEDHDNSSK